MFTIDCQGRANQLRELADKLGDNHDLYSELNDLADEYECVGLDETVYTQAYATFEEMKENNEEIFVDWVWCDRVGVDV